MDEYLLLRQAAALKRDHALRIARDEYRETLKRIGELRTKLTSKTHKKAIAALRHIRDVLLELLPKDRTFTFDEAYVLLCQHDPLRHFHKPTVRGMFDQLRLLRVLTKVRKRLGNRVEWARAESGIAKPAMGTALAHEVCEKVLREQGPLLATEIAVRSQAIGYRQDAPVRSILGGLIGEMRNQPDKFKQDKDKRWALV